MSSLISKEEIDKIIKILGKTLYEIEHNSIFLNVNPDYILKIFKKKLEEQFK